MTMNGEADMTTTPDWHPHGYEVSGAEDDLTDAQARHVATGGRGHHLTGPRHFEEAELAAERARDLLEGRDPRYTATEEDRDLSQEALEGQAWAAVAQAHAALSRVALEAAKLNARASGYDSDGAWETAIL
jgi:hypothetical protein